MPQKKHEKASTMSPSLLLLVSPPIQIVLFCFMFFFAAYSRLGCISLGPSCKIKIKTLRMVFALEFSSTHKNIWRTNITQSTQGCRCDGT